MSSSQTIQLVVLAAVAVFLILRLRGVLGTRDGFEPTVQIEPVLPSRDNVIDLTAEEVDPIADHVDPLSPTADALRKMREIEPAFDIGGFIGGAKQAYEMILMAFERGDLSQVRPFLSDAVASAFQQVIDQRQAAGEIVEAEFLGTHETTLAGAEFDPSTRSAEITIRYVGEITRSIRLADGTLKGDDESRRARKQRDIWTFQRQMGDADPNWRLVATG